jgi:phosphoenolpyruvate phosphomutase
MGKRMEGLTLERPKCLLEIGDGETILYRQIRALSKCGIRDLVITTGPHADMIENHVSKHWPDTKAQYVHNAMYASTNYMYSMLLTTEYIDEDLILMHGDTVFHDEVLERLVASKHPNAVLVNPYAELPKKDFKGRLENGLIKTISVDLFGKGCYLLTPMYKLSLSTFKRWIKEIEVFRARGHLDIYAEDGLNSIISDVELRPVFVKNNELCMEVDNAHDLKQARCLTTHE